MHNLLLEPSGHFTGDMMVGLLCDLGVKPSTFEWELAKADLGAFHLHFERWSEEEAQGVHFGIHTGAVHTHDQDADEGTSHEVHAHANGDAEDDSEHEPRHEHGEHEHCPDHHDHGHDGQSATKLRSRFAASDLTEAIKQRVLHVFDQFCVKESAKLDAEPQTLAFDPDSVLTIGAQIVCTCAGLEELGIGEIQSAAVVDDPMASAILEVYRAAKTTSSASAGTQGKTGFGIGSDGLLRGTLF